MIDHDAIRGFAKELVAMNKKFLDASFQDPDLIGKSVDFKVGYTQGFSEASIMVCQLLIAFMEKRA